MNSHAWKPIMHISRVTPTAFTVLVSVLEAQHYNNLAFVSIELLQQNALSYKG